MAKKKVVLDNGPVEIVAILDRSGSTASIKNDIIGGFNSFIEEQQKVPGAANVTVVQFDSQYDILQDRAPLAEAMKLDDKVFVPRGSTALHDAIGRTVARFKELHAKGEAQKVIVAVLTDGEENSSTEWSGDQVKALVTEVQDKLNWQVVFLAANQDAALTGGKLGVAARNTMNFAATSKGLLDASAAMSGYTTSYRTAPQKKD